RYRHRGPFGRPLVALLIIFAVVAPVSAPVLAALLAGMIVFTMFLLAGRGAVMVMRHLERRDRRTLRRQQPAPMRARSSPASFTRTSPSSDWRATRARFAQLRSEYGQFECDPLAVLRLPALTDVNVPSTARFVDAFAKAQALDTDTEPPAEHRG